VLKLQNSEDPEIELREKAAAPFNEVAQDKAIVAPSLLPPINCARALRERTMRSVEKNIEVSFLNN